MWVAIFSLTSTLWASWARRFVLELAPWSICCCFHFARAPSIAFMTPAWQIARAETLCFAAARALPRESLRRRPCVTSSLVFHRAFFTSLSWCGVIWAWRSCAAPAPRYSICFIIPIHFSSRSSVVYRPAAGFVSRGSLRGCWLEFVNQMRSLH